MRPQTFKSRTGDIKLPVFFPDATRAVLRTLDSVDIANSKTNGILVNTWHLYRELGKSIFKNYDGVREFMNWDGAVISDSGGFQVMSIVKKIDGKGSITDEGVYFRLTKTKKVLFTPEKSVEFQMMLKPDMVVVLDDFTPPGARIGSAKKTVDRTIDWAVRSKEEFERQCKKRKIADKDRPYLLGVVQGGEYQDLRVECTKRLVDIGFDGLGYGGWPIDLEGNFNYKTAEAIAQNAPDSYLLYGLGIGKPDEIVKCVDIGFDIFDCVLPTRDARHKRLYVYDAPSMEAINIRSEKFFSYYVPDKERHYKDTSPVSTACDCLLCTHYSRAYLAHLFRIQDSTALRLATIHNLRFYSILMESLRDERT